MSEPYSSRFVDPSPNRRPQARPHERLQQDNDTEVPGRLKPVALVFVGLPCGGSQLFLSKLHFDKNKKPAIAGLVIAGLAVLFFCLASLC